MTGCIHGISGAASDPNHRSKTGEPLALLPTVPGLTVFLSLPLAYLPFFSLSIPLPVSLFLSLSPLVKVYFVVYFRRLSEAVISLSLWDNCGQHVIMGRSGDLINVMKVGKAIE